MITNDNIVTRVRDVLNEHGGADGLSIGTDRVLLDDYIQRGIADAVVLLASKGYSVNEQSLAAADDEGEGKFSLPASFVSLIGAKLKDWRVEVKELTVVGSPEYRMAMNPYTAPGVNSPICYKDGDMLVCMPASALGTIKVNVAYNSEVGLKTEEREVNAVVYMAAALVLGFFEDDNGKQRLSNIATEFLQ